MENMLAIVIILTFLRDITGRCHFPSLVQTHATSQWWLYHITAGGAQMSTNSLYFVEYLHDRMIMTPLSGPQSPDHPQAFQRECVKSLNKTTFVVRTVAENVEYYCLRFMIRSSNVFQLEVSNMFPRAEDTKCDELHRDPWPFIRYNIPPKSYSPCPLLGGFDLELRNSTGGSLCDADVMPPRFEYRCNTDDVIYLKVDACRLAQSVLGIEARSKFICVAHWQEQQETVIILKRHDVSLFWLLILHAQGSHYKGILSSDIFIDNQEPTSKSTALISLQRRVLNLTCMDFSPTCDMQKDTCSMDVAASAYCAKSCGICKPEDTPLCNISDSLHGSWLAFERTSVHEVSITNHSLLIDDVTLQCIDNDKLLDTYTLIAFNDNGCHPKYKCLKVSNEHNGTVRYDFDFGPTWPVFTKDHLCTPYMMKNDIQHYHQLSLAIRTPTYDIIGCDIPSGTHSIRSLFSDGNTCEGFMSKQTCKEETMESNMSNSSVIEVYYTLCKNAVREHHVQYTCMFTPPSRDADKQMVIVKSEKELSYFCLLYDTAFTELVILPAAKCYEGHSNSDILSSHVLTFESEHCLNTSALAHETVTSPPKILTSYPDDYNDDITQAYESFVESFPQSNISDTDIAMVTNSTSNHILGSLPLLSTCFICISLKSFS